MLPTFCLQQNLAVWASTGAYSRSMGDVVQLPVRREQPQEPDEPRRETPARAPLETPPLQTPPLQTPPLETPAGVEPLWRESVGHELRQERLASGKRLIDVAEEAGVSPQYLSEVERGLKDPSSELLAAIAGALGLSVAEIATRVASSTARGSAPQSPVCLAA
jgi:DNA-binding XRE family transcriptional regulator